MSRSEPSSSSAESSRGFWSSLSVALGRPLFLGGISGEKKYLKTIGIYLPSILRYFMIETELQEALKK
jgi:hypothetical protein